MFGDLNPGIVIGGAAAVISVFAALTALYLWAVNRARQKVGPTIDPQTRAVAPWLVPLLLPTLIVLCLGLIKALWQAYDQRSWPEASTIVFTAWPAFCILALWLKIRKSNVPPKSSADDSVEMTIGH
jgi:hypothetical protein